MNKQNQIFLFRYDFDFFAERKAIWITPGGGLDEGESFEDALKRELFEGGIYETTFFCRFKGL